MQDNEQQDKDIFEKVSCELEKQMQDIYDQKISKENVDYLYKIEDIHKDIANEFYWKEKIDNMRYMNMGRNRISDGYRARSRDSRGRYMGVDDYGRPYRPEDYLKDMQERYSDYSYGRERYGTDNATLESLDAMLNSGKDFFKHLKHNAKTQEEVEMIKEAAREIAEM